MKSKGNSIRRRWDPETWWAHWEQQKEDPRVNFRRQAINDFRRKLDVASPRPTTDSGSIHGYSSITGQGGGAPPHGQTSSIPWAQPETGNLDYAGETEGLSEFLKARLPRFPPGAADNARSQSPGPAGDKVVGDG